MQHVLCALSSSMVLQEFPIHMSSKWEPGFSVMFSAFDASHPRTSANRNNKKHLPRKRRRRPQHLSWWWQARLTGGTHESWAPGPHRWPQNSKGKKRWRVSDGSRCSQLSWYSRRPCPGGSTSVSPTFIPFVGHQIWLVFKKEKKFSFLRQNI